MNSLVFVTADESGKLYLCWNKKGMVKEIICAAWKQQLLSHSSSFKTFRDVINACPEAFDRMSWRIDNFVVWNNRYGVAEAINKIALRFVADFNAMKRV